MPPAGVAATGTGPSERAQRGGVIQGLDTEIVRHEPDENANCSDEDMCHRRSKLARGSRSYGSYESEEKSRNEPIRRRRSRP